MLVPWRVYLYTLVQQDNRTIIHWIFQGPCIVQHKLFQWFKFRCWCPLIMGSDDWQTWCALASEMSISPQQRLGSSDHIVGAAVGYCHQPDSCLHCECKDSLYIGMIISHCRGITNWFNTWKCTVHGPGTTKSCYLNSHVCFWKKMFMKSISIVKVHATIDLMLNLPIKAHQIEVMTMTKPEPFSLSVEFAKVKQCFFGESPSGIAKFTPSIFSSQHPWWSGGFLSGKRRSAKSSSMIITLGHLDWESHLIWGPFPWDLSTEPHP